jgi:CxxC motif-containing protein (DUF1111 family)
VRASGTRNTHAVCSLSLNAEYDYQRRARLGQRIFFLHDGRTTDLISAVRAHGSTGSEANSVVLNFFGLSENQKQQLLNFLRSL